MHSSPPFFKDHEHLPAVLREDNHCYFASDLRNDPGHPGTWNLFLGPFEQIHTRNVQVKNWNQKISHCFGIFQGLSTSPLPMAAEPRPLLPVLQEHPNRSCSYRAVLWQRISVDCFPQEVPFPFAEQSVIHRSTNQPSLPACLTNPPCQETQIL